MYQKRGGVPEPQSSCTASDPNRFSLWQTHCWPLSSLGGGPERTEALLNRAILKQKKRGGSSTETVLNNGWRLAAVGGW